MIHHQWNFITLSNKYIRSDTDIPGYQKMRISPVKKKTKINHSNKILIRAVLRQKSFPEVIPSDNNTYIFTLYTNTGEIDPLWMIISNLTSTKYTNLPLFLLVEQKFYSSQDYHFQFKPHIEEEATMMMNHLIPVLLFK